MARIPLDTAHRGLLARFTAWYCRRAFGRVLEPLAAASHHPAVLWSGVRLELSVQRRWHRLDPTLQALAVMAPAAQIGCSWCLDFGFWESYRKGVDRRKLEDVLRWRQSDAFTEVERLVLEYAEAMTVTPPEVDDALVARLREHLDDAQLVELTAFVALENMRSRTNAALGLRSQGFKDACDLAPAGPAATPARRPGD